MIPQYTELKNTILQYNPYFKSGYDNVLAVTEGIFSPKNELLIFPNDTLSDYFYIRATQPSTIQSNAQHQITACASPFAISAQSVIVAAVRKADSMILANNILSTLSYSGVTARNITLLSESVVIQELGIMGEDVVKNTLANLDKNITIISISFDYYIPLPQYRLNCLPNPCKECS